MHNKPIASRPSSLQTKKPSTTALTKCFICNQIFYTQISFDTHMKQHSSKLDRGTGEDVQRRTMESFRVKMGKGRDGLNATLRVGGEREEKTEQKEQMKKGKEMKEVNEMKEQSKKKAKQAEENAQAEQQIEQMQQQLRKSTLLLTQIHNLTLQSPTPAPPTPTPVPQPILTPTLTQSQLLHLYLQTHCLTTSQITSASLSDPQLINYQQQLAYLSQLTRLLDSSTINQQKLDTIMDEIVAAICRHIDDSLLEDGGKWGAQGADRGGSEKQKRESESKEEQGRQEENATVSYCCGCYSVIEYGQRCMIGAGTWHLQCWDDRQTSN